jgi:hypothetical protein
MGRVDWRRIVERFERLLTGPSCHDAERILQPGEVS